MNSITMSYYKLTDKECGFLIDMIDFHEVDDIISHTDTTVEELVSLTDKLMVNLDLPERVIPCCGES